jgi:hypothetical protein
VPRIPQMFIPELVRRMENEGRRVKFPQALFDQAESARVLSARGWSLGTR